MTEQELFLKHKEQNDTQNLAYRDRDWYSLGFKDGFNRNIYVNNFAKNLRTLRIGAGLTLEDLTGRSGVAHKTINKYETGLTQPPLDKLIALAKALDVSVSFLISANIELKISVIK